MINRRNLVLGMSSIALGAAIPVPAHARERIILIFDDEGIAARARQSIARGRTPAGQELPGNPILQEVDFRDEGFALADLDGAHSVYIACRPETQRTTASMLKIAKRDAIIVLCS